jgi:hypothetical protein
MYGINPVDWQECGSVGEMRGKNALEKDESASVSEMRGIFALLKGAGCRSVSIFII